MNADEVSRENTAMGRSIVPNLSLTWVAKPVHVGPPANGVGEQLHWTPKPFSQKMFLVTGNPNQP